MSDIKVHTEADAKTHDVVDKPSQQIINEWATQEGGFVDRPVLEKRLLRKLDLRFSILVVIYILNYIDRNNVSSARTRGFEEDLNLKGREYDTILSILYVGYLLMQIPSNMLIQGLGRPSLYMSVCILIWGGISVAMAGAKSFGPALACRFLLGFVEAAFFPGALFLLSKWYTKSEYGLRTAILYCGSLISNAFGPLIAAGVLDGMEGKAGLRAWRWLFIIEGSLTMAFAFVNWAMLPDFPENTRSLSAEERALAELRMTEDFGGKDIDTTSPGQAVVAVLTDYKAWTFALSLTAMVVGLAFNAFFPQLTATLGGFTRTQSLLLCAPPWAFATMMAFAVSRHSDKTQERYLHIVIPLVFGCIGAAIAMGTLNTGARYFAMFLMASSYAGFVCLLAWIPSVFPRPAMKRAVAIAFINAFSQLGNVSGAYVWPKVWAPKYLQSFGISIACFAACIIGVSFLRWRLSLLNKELSEQDERGEANVLSGVELPKGFRYVL